MLRTPAVSRRRLLAGTLAPAVAAARQSGALRITSVEAFPVALNFGADSPNTTFRSDFDPRRWRHRGPLAQLGGAIIVVIRTNQGITGFGMGGGGGAAAYVIEHHLRDFLLGADPRHIEALVDQLYASTNMYGRRGLVVMAISGVDLALWDIAGKYARQPVYRLLGGPCRDKVPAYYTGNPEKGLKLGFRAFKLAIRDGVAEGREGMARTVALVAEARRAIGPDSELMIDCGCLWDVPYTLEMDRRLGEFRLKFIEEPLSPDDIPGYERLCLEIRHTQIASGEHEYTRWGFAELLRHKAVHVLQPDVTWSGGLTECRRIAAMASGHSLPVIPHRGGSPYGMALILTCPNCELAESFGTGEAGNELMSTMTPRFENGYYYPSPGPGFGAELSEEMVRKHLRRR